MCHAVLPLEGRVSLLLALIVRSRFVSLFRHSRYIGMVDVRESASACLCVRAMCMRVYDVAIARRLASMCSSWFDRCTDAHAHATLCIGRGARARSVKSSRRLVPFPLYSRSLSLDIFSLPHPVPLFSYVHRASLSTAGSFHSHLHLPTFNTVPTSPPLTSFPHTVSCLVIYRCISFDDTQRGRGRSRRASPSKDSL